MTAHSVDTVASTMSPKAIHQQTIPRQLVHRCAIAEVFVTSLGRRDGGSDLDGSGDVTDDFVIGAQLPRMHAFYGDHLGAQAAQHDPLAVMEAARQGAIAVTHEFLAVPLDSSFLVRRFNGVATTGPAWMLDGGPADLDIALRVVDRHHVRGLLRGVDMVLEISTSGCHMMTVDGSFSWTAPHEWQAIRAQGRGGAPDPVALTVGERARPEVVGREVRRNVVIGPPVVAADTTRAALVVDLEHSALFDHELDHVPGGLLLEACRQMAITHVGSGFGVRAIRSDFLRFVELDRPAVCVAVTGPPTDASVVTVTVEQDGEVCARADIEMS